MIEKKNPLKQGLKHSLPGPPSVPAIVFGLNVIHLKNKFQSLF